MNALRSPCWRGSVCVCIWKGVARTTFKRMEIRIENTGNHALHFSFYLAHLPPSIIFSFFLLLFFIFILYFCDLYTWIQERSKFGRIGWNANYDFNEFDYDTSVKVLSSCLQSASCSFESGFQWKDLKFLIGEVKNVFFFFTINWCINHCSLDYVQYKFIHVIFM